MTRRWIRAPPTAARQTPGPHTDRRGIPEDVLHRDRHRRALGESRQRAVGASRDRRHRRRSASRRHRHGRGRRGHRDTARRDLRVDRLSLRLGRGSVVVASPRWAPFAAVVSEVLSKVKLVPVDASVTVAPPIRLLLASRAVTVMVVPGAVRPRTRPARRRSWTWPDRSVPAARHRWCPWRRTRPGSRSVPRRSPSPRSSRRPAPRIHELAVARPLGSVGTGVSGSIVPSP